MRKAFLADVPQLVMMMAEFYSDSPYTLNPRRASEAFTSLLADERLGHVWFIQSHSSDVGYIVVTLCHRTVLIRAITTDPGFFQSAGHIPAR